MARRRSIGGCPEGCETTSSNDTSLSFLLRVAILTVKLHYLFIVPWIVLSVPSQDFYGLGPLLIFAVAGLGLAGTVFRVQRLATLASVMLIGLVVAGKVGGDLAKPPSSPDTAVLLVQFVAAIFFLEASRVVIAFDRASYSLSGKMDEMSEIAKRRLEGWITGQLSRQAQLIVGALGLSLVLLVLGSLTSISIGHIAFSAILVLLVVGILLFLITQKREPAHERGRWISKGMFVSLRFRVTQSTGLF